MRSPRPSFSDDDNQRLIEHFVERIYAEKNAGMRHVLIALLTAIETKVGVAPLLEAGGNGSGHA